MERHSQHNEYLEKEIGRESKQNSCLKTGGNTMDGGSVEEKSKHNISDWERQWLNLERLICKTRVDKSCGSKVPFFCGTRHFYQLRTEPISWKATKADWDGKMMECTVCSTPLPSHGSSQPKSQAPSIIWLTTITAHIQHRKKREIPVVG